MYTLTGLYLLAPILSRWIVAAERKELRFYLLLCGITFIYPYLSIVLMVNETITGSLFYFSGYIGYFLLGYYLNRYKARKQTIIAASLIGIGGAGAILALKVNGVEFEFYSLFWYLSLPIAAMCVGRFYKLR